MRQYGVPWKFFKAQLLQESRLDPKAVSYVGASGLGQIMPKTWEELVKKLHFPVYATVWTPEYNIHASAYYQATRIKQWSSPRPINDRMNLGLASYNAGLGNILKAQKLCGGVNLYEDIIKCLKCVTGRHSKETITYVKRINQYYIRIAFD